MRRVFFAAACLALLGLPAAVVMAQAPTEQDIQSQMPAVTNGVPAGIQTGPGDIPAAPDIAAAVPAAAIPDVPNEARTLLGDGKIIEVICLSTRWKSGDYFSLIEAIKESLLPAVVKMGELGVSADLPDLDGLKAKGEAALAAVCGSKTLEEASAAVAAFSDLGNGAAGQFRAWRSQLEARGKAKGDELRDLVQKDIESLVSSRTAAIEARLKTLADQKAADAKSALEAEVQSKKFTSADAANAYVSGRVAALKSSITAELRSLAKADEKELTDAVTARVEELVGPEKRKFEEAAKAFASMSELIQAGIDSRRKNYDAYRDQARAKRKALIMQLVDDSIAQARAELERHRGEFDAAKKGDPSIPGVDEILAEAGRDRAALESKLDQALAADNEAAVDAAIAGFRGKWENYRAQAEKAFMNPTAICKIAREQFAAARPALQAGLQKITDAVMSCGQSDVYPQDACAEIEELKPRFNAISGKVKQIEGSMKFIEGLCDRSAAGGQLDPALLAELESLRVQGEEARTFGQALEAEKAQAQQAALGRAQDACAQALPQIQAGRIEMNDRLAEMKAKQAACAGKTDPECRKIGELKSRFDSIQAKADRLAAAMVKVEKTCLALSDQTTLEDMAVLFSGFQASRGEFEGWVDEIKYDAASLTQAAEVCGAAQPLLESANRDLAQAIQRLQTKRDGPLARARAACSRDASQVFCGKVTAAVAKLQEIMSRYGNYGTAYWALNRRCSDAYGSDAVRSQVPMDEVISAVKALRAQGEALRTMGTETENSLKELEPYSR